MIDNERKLIRLAQNNDMMAFETLIKRYDRRILALAWKFTGDLDAAQDLYQEIFLRVFRGIGHFRFESLFSTWLYRVATNTCLTHAEARQRQTLSSLETEVARLDNDTEQQHRTWPESLKSLPVSYQNVFGGEIKKLIQEALETLSPQQRMVFVLRHYEGHKLKKIAEILGCKDGTVKKHLFTATLRLRQQLSEIRL